MFGKGHKIMFGRRWEMKKQTERAWRQAAETRASQQQRRGPVRSFRELGNEQLHSQKREGVGRKSDKRCREKRNEYTGEEN